MYLEGETVFLKTKSTNAKPVSQGQDRRNQETGEQLSPQILTESKPVPSKSDFQTFRRPWGGLQKPVF